MKKTRKVILIASGLVLVLILLIAGKIAIGTMIDKAQNISAVMPDLSDTPDGKYVGEYSVAPVYVKLEAAVHDHQITNVIILQHDNGLGSAAEKIVNDVIENQSLEVDAAAGATVSSKCILKALENALERK